MASPTLSSSPPLPSPPLLSSEDETRQRRERDRPRPRRGRSDPSAQSLVRAPGRRRRPRLRVPALVNGRPDRARQPDCSIQPSSRCTHASSGEPWPYLGAEMAPSPTPVSGRSPSVITDYDYDFS